MKHFYILILSSISLIACKTTSRVSSRDKRLTLDSAQLQKCIDCTFGEHSAATQKTASLLLGNPDFKEAIIEYTPIADRAFHDYMGAQKPTVIPYIHPQYKSLMFDKRELFDITQTSMCEGEGVTKLKPHLSSLFNNSDKEGRLTWYLLLQACLGHEENNDRWEVGTSQWYERDSHAGGKNRRKYVAGFLSIDAFASQNPAIMDSCIDTWNQEGHVSQIKNSRGIPRNGLPLKTVITDESTRYGGQEFSIRCGAQLFTMQSAYQEKKRGCTNPFLKDLNHFGPLMAESTKIQACMTDLIQGRKSLSGVNVQDLLNEIYARAQLKKGPPSKNEKVLVDSEKRSSPSPTMRRGGWHAT